MLRRLRHFLVFATLVAVGCTMVGSASADTFDHDHIIDDGIFDNVSTMSAGQIDTWLNTNFGSTSCISTTHGFSAPEPIGYNPTDGYLFGSNVSAGQIIYDAAQAYSINPQVILTTLQKEQTLVSGGAGCSTLRYTAAAGYGCPDGGTTYNYSGVNLYSINGVAVTSVSGTCVNTALKAGFSQQVIRAAWLLKFGEQRSEGNINWAVVKGNWNNSDDPQSCYGGPMTQGTYAICPSGGTTYYDGYTTIDGEAVHMDTGSTATLYWYTPHFSGNQSFSDIFLGWFSSTYTSDYYWNYIGQAAYTDQSATTPINIANLLPGQRFYVVLVAENVGKLTWYNSGTNPVNLGTDGPIDRQSGFCDSTWLSCTRPATTSQASVAPGQTASFGFWMQAPTRTGTYNEHFNLVAEGKTWMNDPGMYWGITVNPPTYSWQFAGQAIYSDAAHTQPIPNAPLSPGKAYYVTLSALNVGNTTWTNSGSNPVNLGTSGPHDRNSVFCDATWLSCNRPATLTQASVAPGQVGTFEFKLNAPASYGDHAEYFNVVAEGKTWMNDLGQYWQLNVRTPIALWQFAGQAAYTDSSKSTPLNLASVANTTRFYVTLSALNVGNTTWTNSGSNPVNLGTSGPHDRNSVFCDATWLSCNRPATLTQASVAPGQVGTFAFWMNEPYAINGTSLREYFLPVVEGTSWMNDLGQYWQMTAQTSLSQWQYMGQGTFSDSALKNPVDPAHTTTNTTYYLQLSAKNTGGSTWTNGGTNPLNLGTTNPNDRNSSFCTATWLSCNRPATLTQASVAPGQVGTFVFQVKTPAASGTYNEYFDPVIEGTTWLTNLGLYWGFTTS